jgi:hypothetical protein
LSALGSPDKNWQTDRPRRPDSRRLRLGECTVILERVLVQVQAVAVLDVRRVAEGEDVPTELGDSGHDEVLGLRLIEVDPVST